MVAVEDQQWIYLLRGGWSGRSRWSFLHTMSHSRCSAIATFTLLISKMNVLQ